MRTMRSSCVSIQSVCSSSLTRMSSTVRPPPRDHVSNLAVRDSFAETDDHGPSPSSGRPVNREEIGERPKEWPMPDAVQLAPDGTLDLRGLPLDPADPHAEAGPLF
jgi:hypothetical protein